MQKERDELGDGEVELKDRITAQMEILDEDLEWLKASALERGKHSNYRAAEAGRACRDEDGL